VTCRRWDFTKNRASKARSGERNGARAAPACDPIASADEAVAIARHRLIIFSGNVIVANAATSLAAEP